MSQRAMLSRILSRNGLFGALGLAVLGALAPGAWAQELEPRAYSNAPVGLNFLVLGYGYTQGSVAFDPAVPIDNAELRTHNAVLGYARVLDAWGHSAKVDVIVPYTWLDGSADVAGEPRNRTVNGFADPKLRFSVNFLGAPALPLKEFGGYRQDLILGVSLQISAPWGQYDDTKLVNIGTHRWSFKPEIGVSKRWGAWILELSSGVTLYTNNEDFLNGGTLEQAPLYAVQAHLVYDFSSGIWAALDGNYYAGGRTTVNGVKGDTFQTNTRLGLTVALPIDRQNSIKLYGSTGLTSRTGTDYDVVGIAWQYRWGAGF